MQPDSSKSRNSEVLKLAQDILALAPNEERIECELAEKGKPQ